MRGHSSSGRGTPDSLARVAPYTGRNTVSLTSDTYMLC